MRGRHQRCLGFSKGREETRERFSIEEIEMQTESSGAQSEEEEERAGKEASRSCSSTRGQHWHRVGFAKEEHEGVGGRSAKIE
jgi:hypothetical protein